MLLLPQALKNRQNARTGKPVKDLFAPLVVDDDSGIFQNGEVPAHGGEPDSDRFDKFADAMLLAIRKLLDDPEPRRMPERLEDFRLVTTAVFIKFQHGFSCYLVI